MPNPAAHFDRAFSSRPRLLVCGHHDGSLANSMSMHFFAKICTSETETGLSRTSMAFSPGIRV